MQQYELMLMLLPDLGEKALSNSISEIKDLLNNFGGKIFQEDVWGVKDLAYRIKKQDQGYYLVWNLELPGSAVSELEKNLNINQSVLRYLLLKTPKHYTFKTLAQYEEEAEQAALEAAKETSEKSQEEAPKPSAKKTKSKEDTSDKLASIIDDPDISL